MFNLLPGIETISNYLVVFSGTLGGAAGSRSERTAK